LWRRKTRGLRFLSLKKEEGVDGRIIKLPNFEVGDVIKKDAVLCACFYRTHSPKECLYGFVPYGLFEKAVWQIQRLEKLKPITQAAIEAAWYKE